MSPPLNKYKNNPEKQTIAKHASYTHLRAHEIPEHLVCRLLLEKKNTSTRDTERLINHILTFT